MPHRAQSLKIFFSAGEPSGDVHAANLIRQIQSRCPQVHAVGYGGPHMARAGCHLMYDLTALAVMWFGRVLLNIATFWRLYRKAARYFETHRPDAVVLVDYPGFNWWIAKAAKRRGIPVYYYMPPQIWAWARWRIGKMRRWVDHVLCGLPFEAQWFAQRGCRTEFVGHPFFDETCRHEGDPVFLAEQRRREGPLVVVLPGSRNQEVTGNLDVFFDACRKIYQAVPNVRFAVACFKPQHADYARPRAAATGLPMRCESDFGRAAEALLRRLDLESVLVTLDRDGAFLAVGESERHWLRGRPRQVYDVTGAGDMVLAALTALRAGGASWLDAASVATAAGGLEVEKLGVVPISRREIIDELLLESGQRAGKRRSLPDLLADIARHRAAGRSVVFTNGCFDLVHLGHISYFQFAKRQGDVLVVAVNTDASIRRLKGDKRPIIPEDDRVRVLEELESIDYLITFDEDTPLGLIESIRPDVLVKGADYRKQQVVGWEQVESWGGRVALAPLVDGRSTSALIQRVLEAYRT